MIQQQKSCDLLIYSKTFFFLFFVSFIIDYQNLYYNFKKMEGAG